MKIIVNKEAALQRAKDIVGRIREKALETAAQGKVDFMVEVKPDELNGISYNLIKEMVNKEFEGTIKFRAEPTPVIMLLEIVVK